MRYFILTSLAAALMIGCSSEATPTEEVVAASAVLSDKLPALSGDHVWTMDPAQSQLQFQAYYNGDFTAEFERFQTAIRLNPDDLTGAEIHAIVDLSSLKAKNNDVKNNLPGKDWFHVSEHPYATYSSTDITSRAGNYMAKGEMTIKGASNPAALVFTLDINGDTAKAAGEITLSRLEYNVGTGSDFQTEDWVKFPVKVMIDITAKR